MKWSRKIKAGALQFVLFIGAIIAILLLTFLLITHTHSFFDKKTDILVDIIQEADFGLSYAFQKGMPTNSFIEINAQSNKEIVVTVTKDFWGIFERYRSKARFKNLTYSKIALVGGNSPKGLMALTLKDKQRPLIVAGSTKITGDVLVPQQGIRMGNIAGNSYQHGRLVYGRSQASSATLPKLNDEVIKHMGQFINNFQNKVEVLALKPKMKLENSFESPTQYIRGATIRLEEISLIGNIVVSATHKIVVEPTAILKDIILVAPEISIKDRVKGVFQALASKHINVGRHCEFGYPTALVVLKKSNKNGVDDKGAEPKLFIESNSRLNGMVVYLDESEEQMYAPQIKIAANTIITGEIYSTKNLELKGSVIGSVTTDAFIALENGSIYQNHLYNGSINSTLLPREYSGLVIGNVQHKKVMKWLY